MAEKNMTIEQENQCEMIIHAAAASCAAIGVSPIPGSDAPLLIAAQVTMLVALSRVFDISLSKSVAESMAKTAFASNIGKVAAGQFAKMIPFFGSVNNAGVAFSITEMIGWDAAREFAKQAQQENLLSVNV